MFLAFILIMGNLFCLMLDGAWLGADDMNLMNYLTGYSNFQSAGAWAVVTVPLGFFVHGLPKMLFWDFSFFDGAFAIVRWILMIVSIGAVWAVGQEFRGTITSIFGRR
jgi:hypothetical protein